MKKLLCLAAASVLGFAAFADGPLALTVDTIAGWDSENGLGVGVGDDGFFAEVKGSYEAEKGGAMFRLRAFGLGNDYQKMPVDTDPDSGGLATVGSFASFGPVILDRYEAWVKPNEIFKVSIGSEPLELYNEEVKWDVPFGAGLFEGGMHVYTETYPVDGLTLGAGVGSAGLSKDVQYGLAAWATYDISCVGNISAEYQALGKNMKVVAAQFNYNGIDNMNILFGYSTVLVNNEVKDETDLAQHRVSADFRMSSEAFAFEAFNEAIIRNKDYGNFGDRFAAKFSYFLNDSVTPWLRAQCFMNYGTSWGGNEVAWSEAQLADIYTGDNNVTKKDDWKVIVEPKVSIDFGKGVSAILGAQINYASYDLVADKKLTWSIPVEFIVAF